MIKTTVYFPRLLKKKLQALAKEARRSEAELIREAVERLVDGQPRKRPTLPLFNSGDGTLARRVDEVLAESFGREGLGD